MRWTSTLVALSILTFASAALAQDDTVLLANGGRVRGTIIQEEKGRSVRIRTADGSVRDIAAKDIKEIRYGEEAGATGTPPAAAPAAPPAGAVHVEAGEAASVSIDGGFVGKAPVDMKGLATGRHVLRVEFASGERWDRPVMVQPGETVEVVVPPAARRTGMMAAGIALCAVSLVLDVIVIAGKAAATNDNKDPIFIALGATAGATAAAGIPLWIIGSRMVHPKVALDRPPAWAQAVPTLAVTRTGGPAAGPAITATTLGWTF